MHRQSDGRFIWQRLFHRLATVSRFRTSHMIWSIRNCGKGVGSIASLARHAARILCWAASFGARLNSSAICCIVDSKSWRFIGKLLSEGSLLIGLSNPLAICRDWKRNKNPFDLKD